MRRLLAGVIVLGAAVVVGAIAAPALGYGFRKGHCDALADVDYYFAGSGWTSTTEEWFILGAEVWDFVPSPSGGTYTTSTPEQGGPIEIWLIDEPGDGGGGVTDCDWLGNLNSITVDPEGFNSAKWEGVAAHEMGARTRPRARRSRRFIRRRDCHNDCRLRYRSCGSHIRGLPASQAG